MILIWSGGLLISDNKAKELQAKNNSINWELSDAECAIVESLGVNID